MKSRSIFQPLSATRFERSTNASYVLGQIYPLVPSMEANPMVSSRGHSMVVVNNYKFRNPHFAKDGTVRWRCAKKSCRAKLTTGDCTDFVVCTDVVHNHPPEQKLERQRFNNVAKLTAMQNFNEKASKVVHSQLGMEEFKNTTLDEEDFSHVERNIRRTRRDKMKGFSWLYE